MSRKTRPSLSFGSRDARERFNTAKRQAQSRMGRSDLSNAEFMNLLLDVYQLHLHEPSQPVTEEVSA